MAGSFIKGKLQRPYGHGLSVDANAWLYAGGVIVYCVFVIFGAYQGVRGSDEYWYLADIMTLIEGRGPHSNFVFPFTLLTDTYTGPRPFVHNILYPYLAALPGHFIGAFPGAIVTNAVNHIVASLLILLVVVRVCDDSRLAVAISLMYLFFPLNYWLAINVLAESTLVSLLMILAAVMLCDNWRGWQWFAAAIVIGVMIFARASLLLFAVMLPIAVLLTDKSVMKMRALISLGLLATILSFAWVWGHFFEPNVPCSIIERINVRVPGKTSGMYCLFKLPDQALMLSDWVRKAANNLHEQFRFFNIYSLFFYWPVNLLVILGGYVLLKTKDRNVKILGWLNLGFAAVHMATLVLMANQIRYLVILVPISFVLLAVYLNDNDKSFICKHRYILCGILITGSLIADFRLALYARDDALTSGQQLNQLTQFVNENILSDEKVILEAAEDRHGPSMAIQLGLALRPRSTLMVPSYYETGIYEILLGKFPAEILILRNDSDLYQRLPNVMMDKESNLPGEFSDYSLYRTR